MIEYIALALLAYICYQDFMNRKERKRLVDAFLAKNLRELKEPERKPVGTVDKPVDIPLMEATQDEFDKAIRKEVGKETIVEKGVDKLKSIKFKKR